MNLFLTKIVFFCRLICCLYKYILFQHIPVDFYSSQQAIAKQFIFSQTDARFIFRLNSLYKYVPFIHLTERRVILQKCDSSFCGLHRPTLTLFHNVIPHVRKENSLPHFSAGSAPHIRIYCSSYVTLDHKTSLMLHGYICGNSQQNIVWVKIIDFSFMPKIIRILSKDHVP